MKKLITILICTFSLVLCSFINSSAMDFSENTLKDIDEHWAENAVNTLKNMGVMNGYAGFSNPDSIITRGEFTALITRAFDMKGNENSKKFGDISKDHMFYDAICAAASAGIIDGFADNTFRPDNMITREEIMLILSRLTDYKNSSYKYFADTGKGYMYVNELSKVAGDGIIGGYPDGTFRPYNKTTRAEAATMIVSAIKKYMPGTDIKDVYEFAHGYIVSHFEDISGAYKNSSGSAANDMKYIKNTYNVALKAGYRVSNSVSDINFISYNQNGPFTDFIIEYKVKRNINGLEKEYKGLSELSVISSNSENKIYNHDTRIVMDEPINLTWEVFYDAPSYSTDGVNIVSPTCFRIETSPEGKSKTINFSGNKLYFNSSLTDDYLDYAQKNGYRVWAMYKTDFTTHTASLFLNSNEARKQANDILITEILKNNLDGINFDFENMYKSDKGAYTNHVKEISIMAHVLGAAVSVDITKYEPTSSTWSMCYDRDALSKYADYIMLMAYDQYYSGGKTPGPVAGMEWTENCIKITLKEVDPDKLVLGMPYYIRIWETKNGKAVSSKAVSMESALRQANENNAAAEFDSKFSLTKYTWKKDDKTYMFWLENAQSIGKRVSLAKKYSLAGVASWRRGLETKDVWDTIKIELENWK